MSIHQIILGAAMVFAAPFTKAQAQTAVTDADLVGAYQSRSYDGRVTCHDPSVVIDNITNPSAPTYYIYGSHLGRGKTTAALNYLDWSTFAAGEESTGTENSLFANTSGELVNYSNAYGTHLVKEVKNYKGETVTFGNFDAHGWQYTGNTVAGNQWAPDVVYNKKMKKWCMYMSLNGDNWCSSIVCFISDNIEGPWTFQGPVVFSGFQGNYAHNSYAAADDWKNTDFAIATGEESLPERYSVGKSWGSYWPNCIDPCVFYDDDDNLWMSYGSWSGGIFLLKLNEENGLRDYEHTYKYEVSGTETTPGAASQNCTSDPYFGKKIAGGWYVSGEASYIQKIGSYYYLFMSYGGLTAAGGYQIRTFRSANPDGPYKDCMGIDAVYNKNILNFGADAKRDEGMKLFGNYQWDTMPVAELAQGHNSAMIDERGRAMVVYHTRFNDGTEGHQVRVHQLFVNQDGWLVAAPYEFDGETMTHETLATSQKYTKEEVAGDFQMMAHPYRQDTENKAYETPVTIHLGADGTVTGAYTGTWELVDGTGYINITLNGTATGGADVTFKGVVIDQTVGYTDIPAICFTAVSSSSGSNTAGGASLQTKGLAIWGSKADSKAAIKYTIDKVYVPFQDGATLNTKPVLPTEGYLGTSVSWTSSDKSVMEDDGTVKGKGNVVMTMTVSNADYVYSKEYSLTIDADAEETVPVFYPESELKNTTSGWWANFSQNYVLQAGKKMEFKFYNYSNKAANWNNWYLVAATAERGAADYSEYFVLRNDNYGWFDALGGNTNENTSNVTFELKSDFDFTTFADDMDGSLVDMIVSLDDEGHFSMTSTITTTEQKVYNYSFSMLMTDKPSTLTLFFGSEGSYIDGSSLNTSTGIENIAAGGEAPVKADGNTYNLSGQRVDKSYKGIVIRNGKKYVNK